MDFDGVALPAEKALRLGTVLLRSAHTIRESQVETWTKTPRRYIRFMVNRIRYVFTDSKLETIESYTFL